MTRHTVFMIFLITIIGCRNDVEEVKFSGNELMEFEKIKSDFEAPKYKWDI
jgi:hypothetical protein